MQTLRLFTDVARCHSFSQAAALHGITQSAASQRIGQLEKRLGVTLLDRSVRPLELTEAGRVMLEGAEDILHRYDGLERRVSAAGSEPTGAVRVSAIYSSGIDLLSRVREEFEERWPRMSVHIDYAKPDGVHEAVVEGRADVGILSYPERFKRVGVMALRDEEMCVVCPPNHALAERGSVHARDLTGLEMVAFDTDLPVGRRVSAYLREHGGLPVVANCFDNLDTIKSAVAVTERFTILPRRTVQREAEAGALAVLTLTPTLTRPMGVIYRRNRKQQTPVRAATARFIDFLLAHAGQDSSPTVSAAPPRPTTTPDRPQLVGSQP